MHFIFNFFLSCIHGLLRLLGLKPKQLQQARVRDLGFVEVPVKTVKAERIDPYDDLEQWGHEWTFKPPLPKHEIEEWQKRFDRVFGTNRDGKSCVKLVWNGDQRYWHRYAYDWDSYGRATKWELRPRVLWKKIDLGNGDYVDIFPPRWLLLSRIEPEQYAETWKDESWVNDPTRGPLMRLPKCANCQSVLDFSLTRCDSCGLEIEMATEYVPEGGRKQIRDDEPPKVFWETFEVVGDHDAFCCEAFEGECFGTFRNPGDKELERLRHLRRNFEAQDQTPYEMLSKGTEAKIASFCRDYYRQQYTKMPASAELVVEHADEYLKPLLDFTGDKLSQREQREIVKGALDRHYTEKAEQFEQRLRGE